MVLPPNVSEADFSAALGEFRSAVGADWVFSSDADVALYRDSYSIYWGEPEERVASAAVAPATVEEVQQVVRIANKYRIPLYPISTGRNLTYGGSAPTLRGSLVVDLKRMNRILAVDEKRHFALVEPGVSYFDLYNHIRERNLEVMLDVPDPGWGSPVGNSLDHGVGYTTAPFRDHFGSHCGMEVVTAEGEIIRTGTGAVPNSDNWQDFHYGAGPTIDGLFAQSNFGIVTKMGFWLMPMPEAYLTGTVTVPRYQDFDPLIHEVSYWEDLGLIGMPDYGSPIGGGFFAPPPAALAALMASGWPSIDALERFVGVEARPAWSVRLHFYGPEETVRANWQAAKRRFSGAIPGAAFQDGEFLRLPIPPEQEPTLPDKPRLGIPSLEVFAMVARNPSTANDPADGHADFFAMIPRKASAVWEAARVMFETYREMDTPAPYNPFSTPINYYSRCFIMAAVVPTWRDPARNSRSRELFARIMDRCAERGWGCYRTAPAFQDQLARTYSFNNNALLRFREKLKDSIDPNGILSPGRYGIWPASMRNTRA
ncbi:MAG: FAD-binding oxidoreductase [Acidobacteria bacterium]|nr:FAD-binding oxidoreductase [Acidobacteriota bacterium]